ncbi:MAG TPA: hypothetical protein VII06_03140 [Chloroflexota bacterium]
MDADDRVYVLDAASSQVHKLSARGEPLTCWPLPEGAAADLTGLAVDAEGQTLVADRRQRRLHRLAWDGLLVASWEYRGLCPRCPASPAGLAADPLGNIYVADWSGPAVAKLSPRGAVLAEWRGPRHFGLFHHPAAVALAGDGTIYVADEGSHGIQALTPLGEPGERWGSEGSTLGNLRGPRGVAVDHAGNAYVADTGNARVQKLSVGGCWLADWGSHGRWPGQLWRPSGVAVDGSGHVYVADEGNDRVLKLAPGGEPAAQWGPERGLVVRCAADLPAGDAAGAWRPGGLFHVDTDDGRVGVVKVLAVDAVAVHLRVYQQRFTRRVTDGRLPELTLDAPGDDGLGLAHLAVTPRLFATWHPWFVKEPRKQPLPTEAELRPYRAWQRAQGGVWDLDAPPRGG